MTIRDKRFTAFFLSDLNAPATALSPAITIYDRTSATTAVTAAAMTHVGNGLYEYTCAVYDYEHDYLAFVDGGAALTGANRYVTMANESYAADIDDKLSQSHGVGDWNRIASPAPMRGWGELNKDQLTAITNKLADALEQRELNIPLVLPEAEMRQAMDACMQEVKEAGIEALKRIEAQPVNVEAPDLDSVLVAIDLAADGVKAAVNEAQPDLQPVIDRIDSAETSIRYAVDAAVPDLQPVIEEVKAAAKQTQAVTIKNIDGAYNDICDRMEEADGKNEERKKFIENTKQFLSQQS